MAPPATSSQPPEPSAPDHAIETTASATAPSTRLSAQAEYFSGPIPHPALLEAYERACPGSCEKILKMALDEQANRHALEHKQLDHENSQIRRGQMFGLGITVSMLVAAVVIVLLGNSTASAVAGSLIGAGGIASAATAFVYARNKAKDEGEERQGDKA